MSNTIQYCHYFLIIIIIIIIIYIKENEIESIGLFLPMRIEVLTSSYWSNSFLINHYEDLLIVMIFWRKYPRDRSAIVCSLSFYFFPFINYQRECDASKNEIKYSRKSSSSSRKYVVFRKYSTHIYSSTHPIRRRRKKKLCAKSKWFHHAILLFALKQSIYNSFLHRKFLNDRFFLFFVWYPWLVILKVFFQCVNIDVSSLMLYVFFELTLNSIGAHWERVFFLESQSINLLNCEELLQNRKRWVVISSFYPNYSRGFSLFFLYFEMN